MKSDLPADRALKNCRYAFVALFFLSVVLLYQGLRLVLFLSFPPAPGVPPAEVWKMFLAGVHRDVFVAVILSLPLLVWFCIVPNRWFSAPWHRVMLAGALLVFWGVQVFLLAAEFYFFEEFRSRFNTVAVDYLLYPHEVFINIWDSYPVPWVIGLCLALAAAWLVTVLRLFRGMWIRPVRAPVRIAWVAGGCVLAVVMSFSITLKGIQVSHERLLNEMANNGALSFVAAFWTRNLDFDEFYKTVPKEVAYQHVRRLLEEPSATLDPAPNSIRRQIAGDPTRPKLNVVLILEESLGSEFWGSLGRKEPTLTPRMDKLAAEEGMLFTNIYASGNRTVRGLEGVLSSFPPLPGDSIVKRDLSENVETLARVLKRDGYSTLFLYGGRGLFDGMRSFALNNGYDRFIEQKHFAHPTHATIWGVCDEDVFARSIEECRALDREGSPFFATMLSVSNHKPYTYPAGRIAEDPARRKRSHAVKYSDFALGEFFDAARKERFWTNTVFVVVADHGARVYGSEQIPIHSYEIPLLIAGPAVVRQPARIGALGCSLDVAPTLLGLIGRPYQSLFFGRDLLRGNPAKERVLINHNREIGWYAHEGMVAFGLRKTVEYYRGNPKNSGLALIQEPSPADLEAETNAIALFQVADDLYRRQLYRLDGQTILSKHESGVLNR